MHSMDRRLKMPGLPIAYEKVIQLFEANGISDDVLNYVKRFYVYHCAVLLEYARKVGDIEKIVHPEGKNPTLHGNLSKNKRRPSGTVYMRRMNLLNGA